MARRVLVAASALTLVAVAAGGGAQMKLSFADIGDPNPRHFSLGMEVAGMALGLAISWTRHAVPRA